MLPILFLTGLRHLDPETDYKVRTITSQVSESIKLGANEPSLGFFRIQEHVHRTMPQLVKRKQELKANAQKIEGNSKFSNVLRILLEK